MDVILKSHTLIRAIKVRCVLESNDHSLPQGKQHMEGQQKAKKMSKIQYYLTTKWIVYISYELILITDSP